MGSSARLNGRGRAGTLGALLGSQVRARLLTLFLTRPGDEYYARQIAANANLGLGHVHRQLTRLEQLGLILSCRRGQEKLYRVNERHPLYPELKRIVYKTTGIGDVLREALAAVAGVQAAFIYGSVARDTERATSDIDLFILGVPDRAHLDAVLSEAEDRLGREISLVTMTADEWHARAAAHEGFIEELRRSPKIYLIGDDQSLPRT